MLERNLTPGIIMQQMAGWVERLGRWLAGPPPEPPSEVETRVGEFVRQRKADFEYYQGQQQTEEAEKRAKALEIRRRSLDISQESNIAKLLEDAKRVLQPLYPSVVIHTHWRGEFIYQAPLLGYGEGGVYCTTLAWRGHANGHLYPSAEKLTWPVQLKDDDEYCYIQVACDGINNRLSLIYGPHTIPGSYTRVPVTISTTTRHFAPDEWTNTKITSGAIVEAVKNPAYVPLRDRSE